MSFSAASMPRSIRRKLWNWGTRMRWSKATAIWRGARLCAIARANAPQKIYEGGRVAPEEFKAARWDLLPPDRYMWASVQTVRGCSKHCSFCSVWRTDGQKPRQRPSDVVIEEIVALRRLGFRFIALADDNFYPVSLTDIKNAERQGNQHKVDELKAIREERFELMERLADLPRDLTFFTQITMESAEDGRFLDAMRAAHIRGALVGVEAVTPEGLKAVFKDFNCSGEKLVNQLQEFRRHGVHVLGSFIFGFSTDRTDTFDATLDLAHKSGLTFAQFVMLTPFCGTVDFERWEKAFGDQRPDGGRHADHALLADSAGSAAEDVHAASHHEFGRDAPADAGRVGSLLQFQRGMEAIELHAEFEGAAGVHFYFEAVPADVCEHRYRHR